MIRNPKLVEKFEQHFRKTRSRSFAEQLAAVENLRQLAVSLGKWHPDTSLTGLTRKIALSKVLRSVSNPTQTNR
jgi:hypothetical protein